MLIFDQHIGKIRACGIGHAQRADPAERGAIRCFEDERGRVAPGNGFFWRQVVHRPDHGASKQKDAQDCDDGYSSAETDEDTAQRAGAVFRSRS
jgi:hypothetical protein